MTEKHRETSPKEIIQKLVAKLSSLPESPIVALQIYRLLDDPDTSAQDLAKIILLDPALTAQVLKICNSAEYGFSRKIATISEAVSILGHQVLKRIIFTIISHGYLNRPVQGYILEKGALWENAVTCSVYARAIAGRQRFKDVELAFVGALLRDIGKIALGSSIHGRGDELEETVMNAKCSFEEAESKIIGVSHAEVGAELAVYWNLPESLVKAIRYHHQPSLALNHTSPEDLKLISIIHLADTMTMMTGVGLGIDGLMYPFDHIVFDTLKIEKSSKVLESLYADLLGMEEEIRTMMNALVSTA